MNPPFRIARISNRAQKFITKRDRKIQREIAAALDFVTTVSPYHHPNPETIKRLHGEFEGLFRFRIGSIRIVYSIDESERTIEIVNIDNRGDVYR